MHETTEKHSCTVQQIWLEATGSMVAQGRTTVYHKRPACCCGSLQQQCRQAQGAYRTVNCSLQLLLCRITVKSLTERTDLTALAAEVVEKCKLIHPSKVRLLCLQQHSVSTSSGCMAGPFSHARDSWCACHVLLAFLAPAWLQNAGTVSSSSHRTLSGRAR